MVRNQRLEFRLPGHVTTVGPPQKGWVWPEGNRELESDPKLGRFPSEALESDSRLCVSLCACVSVFANIQDMLFSGPFSVDHDVKTRWIHE